MNTSPESRGITPVILCGGSGTRLWPLSRASYPKQFVPLLERDGGLVTLFDATLERTAALRPDRLLCVTNHEYRFFVKEAMDAAGSDGIQLLEPEGRNTAAAMACAALNCTDDDLLLFLPSDQHIPDVEAFRTAVTRAVPAAEAGFLVTFGVTPDAPRTGFGYIEQGESVPAGDAHRVRRFVEKPPRAEAERMLAHGGFLWNAGMFLMRRDALLAALDEHVPRILAAARNAVARQSVDGSFRWLDAEGFLSSPAESIDYAVLEKHDRVAVVPLDCAWDDVGSWTSVAALAQPDDRGNRIIGRGHMRGADRTYINSADRLVVALGTRDLLIVDTPDALLVVDTAHAEQVKDVVAELQAADTEETAAHRRVPRPWGWYDSVDRGDRFQVKRIMVNPGAKLSLQIHRHRAEHWVVVKGIARVTNGDKVFELTENQSTYIPIGTPHRLENPGTVPLEIIEVQSGGYLGEDDIVRLDDTYGRVAK